MLPPEEGSPTVTAGSVGLSPPVDAAGLPPQPYPISSAAVVVTSPNIQMLTRAAQRGDAQAFSRLYDLYSFRVYKFLLLLARGDEQAAREACQSVFIKLSKRCDVFDHEGRFWAWLCVLARNTFIDHCRLRQRRNRFVPLDELSAEANPPVNADADRRLAEILGEALAGLDSEERELLQAAYLDKRPLRELAEEAGQTYKALESRLGRLRQRLKEQLLKSLRHENEF